MIVGEALSTAFPIWVAVGCLLGLLRPTSFDWVQPKWTVLGITLTMLGMGMTLTFDDLGKALAMPKEILTGFFLQYSVSILFDSFFNKLHMMNNFIVFFMESIYSALVLVDCLLRILCFRNCIVTYKRVR